VFTHNVFFEMLYFRIDKFMDNFCTNTNVNIFLQ